MATTLDIDRILYLLLHFWRFYMTLSPATQALLDQAFASKDTATQLDTVHAGAADTLVLATAAEADAAASALEGHRKATDDAHAAISAIAAELGFPLP